MQRVLAQLVAVAAVLMCGCSSRVEEEQIDNVTRVFWHESNRYSFMVQDPATKHMRIISLPGYVCGDSKGIQIVPDVAASQQMRVQSTIKYVFGNPPCIVSMKIHVRSERDVGGGGWNHGKFGSGQTTVVQ